MSAESRIEQIPEQVSDVKQKPLTREAVLTIIREQLSEILEIEASSVGEDDSFADDLGADSLALIELVEGIEDELSGYSSKFRIEDEDLQDLRSVCDAVDYVMKAMKELG